MDASLTSVQGLPQAKRTDGFLSLLSSTLASSSNLPHDMQLFVQTVTAESTGLVVSRPVLSEFVKAIGTTPPPCAALQNSEVRRRIIEQSIELLTPRVVTYEEQISDLRMQLGDLLEAEEEWVDAAKALVGIPMESGHRPISDDFKLKLYVRIVRLYLEEDDAVSAETFFNRATLLIHTNQDKVLSLHYKLAQARIFDSQRKFNEAGSKYHEISYVTDLDEDDRLAALAAAVTCAILGPAGPQRSRLLATLYRDDRTASLPQQAILSATFLDQIIRPALVSEFASQLKPHQLAKLPPATNMPRNMDEEVSEKAKKSPENVLDRAVMEHNLLSASRIYNNITFKGLGMLLSLTPFASEAMARTMIGQGRLKASIDQVEGLITFDASPRELEGAVSNVAAKSGGELDEREEDVVVADETFRWDLAVRKASQLTEELAARTTLLMAASATA